MFNLIWRNNETRYIKWHETCKWKCRLDASVCNNKHKWDENKCRCEWKELIDERIWDEGYIWNPSNCECECDKSCDIGEYLDYKSCKCKIRLVDKLVEECSEKIDEKKLHSMGLHSIKMIYNSNLNDYKKVCPSCAVLIVLLVIFFIKSISISSVFIYFHWYLKRKYIETIIYWM